MLILRQKSFGLFSGLFKKKAKVPISNVAWMKEAFEWEEIDPEIVDPDFYKFLDILDREVNKLPNKKEMEANYFIPFVNCVPDFNIKGKDWVQVLSFGEDTKEDHLYYCDESGEWLFWDLSSSPGFTVRKKFRDIILPMLGGWYFEQKRYLQDLKSDEEDVPPLLPESIKFLGKMIGICKREFKIIK